MSASPIRFLPWQLAAALLALILLIPAALLPFLQINNSPEIYLSKDEPSVQLQDRLRSLFPDYQVIVLLFEPADISAPEFLHKLESLAQDLKQLPLVDRVHRVTDFEQIARTDDGFAVRPLVDVDKLDQQPVTRERLTADPFAPGFVLAKDGSAAALVIRPTHVPDSPTRQQLLTTIQQKVQAHGLSDVLKASAGQVSVDVAEFESMLHDNLIFVPATMALGLLLIWWLFRRPLAVVMVAVVMAAAAQSALSVLVIAREPFTLVAAILPPFMSAISLAFMVHLLGQLQAVAGSKLSREAQLKTAVGHVFRPSLYAALTTAVGLGSLAVSPIRPVAWFGIAGGVAAMVLFATVNYLLPPLLLRFDKGQWPREPENTKALTRITLRIAHFSMRRAGWVASGFLLATLLTLPLLAKIYTETDIYRFFQDDHPINVSTHEVEAKLSGAMPLDVVFTGPDRDALTDPARLHYIEAFQAYADSLPAVNYSISMVDLLKEMHWAFQEQDSGVRQLPTDKALITQYLFIYDGKDLYDLTDRELKTTRVTLSLTTHSTRELKAVMAQMKTWLAAQPAIDLQVEFGSEARIFTDQEDLLVIGQISGLWLSFIMIFLFFVLMWRSPPVAFMAVLPNAAPIFFVFVFMAVAGVPLDMATALIAGVAVGVAVDDTIHFMESYCLLVQRGRKSSYALLHTLKDSGKACTINTLILSSQFALLLSSTFVPTRNFGFMTALGLITAAIFELLLLPSLLTLLARLSWWQHHVRHARTPRHEQVA
ncbi:MMPL family transporter [Permianibacter sp. IMCC34836]|uniref:efflux RND transporter permease subunit n=1 Tax=Permianibacter fluminis TaxID=2738515 RepID=UPI001553BEAA|nr:MMPL family transporter [Permianibacter fluminis]NQD35623.1 MMPL family transporter [Permianibacter fluminis]